MGQYKNLPVSFSDRILFPLRYQCTLLISAGPALYTTHCMPKRHFSFNPGGLHMTKKSNDNCLSPLHSKTEDTEFMLLVKQTET